MSAGNYPINERVQNETDLQKSPSLREIQFTEACDWIRDELKHNLSRRSWSVNWGTRPQRVVRDSIPGQYIDTEKTMNLMYDGERLSPLSLIRPSFFEDDRIYKNYKRYGHSKSRWINIIDLNNNYENEYYFNIPYDAEIREWLSYSLILGAHQKVRFGGKGIIYLNDVIMDEITIYPLKVEAEGPIPLTPEATINFLFSKNIFRAGLRFICQNCGVEDWYHLTEFDVNFTCRYCFKSQHIGSLEGGNKKEWHYKADGLFMIPNAGEGSLSVITALWRLHHLDQGASFKYITSQDINKQRDGEIDFIATYTDHFQRGNVLVLGEARNFVDFQHKEFSKMIKIGSKFSVKPFLCFATLKDEFSENEKKELKRVMSHGFNIVPLTRLDLDPYDLYKRFDSLRNKYAVTIEELSQNLCMLNLGINEQEVYDFLHPKEAELFKKLRERQEALKKSNNPRV